MSIKERAGIQSVEVGFGLLQVLGEAPGPLMLRDLARAANMSAAKAHRYLVSFQMRGCNGSVRRESRRPQLPKQRINFLVEFLFHLPKKVKGKKAEE